MTTINRQERTCSICGAKSEQNVIASTNSFGSPDLDLRPPEMQRSTMAYWVEECPKCSYVAPSIEKCQPNAQTTMSGDDYQSVLSSPSNSVLYGRLLKASIILEGATDFEAAANYALNAAWAADDTNEVNRARTARNRSFELFSNVVRPLDPNLEKAIVINTRMVDILRRSNRWDECRILSDRLLASQLNETIKSVVIFGRDASSRHDDICYTIEHALAGKS